MQNIMFTEPNPAKILAGDKTLTARNWKRKPPKIGELMTASTGYAKETRFAVIRVLNVWEWELDLEGRGAEKATGMSRQEIAEREGYHKPNRDPDDWITDWHDFATAYYGFNAQNFLKDGRKNYFIKLALVQELQKEP